MSNKNLLSKETVVDLEGLEEAERIQNLVQVFEDEKEFLKIHSEELTKAYSTKSGEDFLEIQFSNLGNHYPGEKIYIKIIYKSKESIPPIIKLNLTKYTKASYFESKIIYLNRTFKIQKSPTFLCFQIPTRISYGPYDIIQNHDFYSNAKYEFEFDLQKTKRRGSFLMNLFQKKLTGKIPLKIYSNPIYLMNEKKGYSYTCQNFEYISNKFTAQFRKKCFYLNEEEICKVTFSGDFYEVNIYLSYKTKFDITGLPVNNKKNYYQFKRIFDSKVENNILLCSFPVSKNNGTVFSKNIKFKIPNDLTPTHEKFEDFGIEYNINVIAVKDDYSYKQTNSRNYYVGGPVVSHPIVISSPILSDKERLSNLTDFNQITEESRIYHDELDHESSVDPLGGLDLLGNLNFM
eukprot:gene11939-5340_t